MHFTRLMELLGLPLLWAVGIYAALQLQNLSLANEHTICGPWGCGPTTSALAAMHLGWFALLGPPILYLPRRLGWTQRAHRRLASVLVGMAMLGIAAIVAWQWFVWLPQAGAWSKQYLLQRCGFAVATAVDLPLIQLAILGGILSLSKCDSPPAQPPNATTAAAGVQDSPPLGELVASETPSPNTNDAGPSHRQNAGRSRQE
ncbi:MAG: hypothetical protein KDA45_04920 [Planctomycetales bacterium]|nr:hypothetical protein [Planctomycetales bacterium]